MEYEISRVHHKALVGVLGGKSPLKMLSFRDFQVAKDNVSGNLRREEML